MKLNPSITILALAIAMVPLARAGELESTTSISEDIHGCQGDGGWTSARPDGHAPIGIMADHTHHTGGWMVSYRYMFMDMKGQRDGTTKLSSNDLFKRGYAVAPTGMDMEMHMISAMYAPTDWLTLMLMTNYQYKSMDHLTKPGSMPRMAKGKTFTEKADGWGDLSLTGLFEIYDLNNQRAHLQLGVSAPTGEFNDRAYPMQPTTGTWDLLPGITWLWQAGDVSGGAQVKGRLHLEDNKYDYHYGNSVGGTTWLAYRLTDWASISGRISLDWADEISGEDTRIAGARMAPPMDPANHGGTWLEGGIGLNLYAPGGSLKGNRLAIEALFPMYQDLNGLQMYRDYTIVAGWQFAF